MKMFIKWFVIVAVIARGNEPPARLANRYSLRANFHPIVYLLYQTLQAARRRTKTGPTEDNTSGNLTPITTRQVHANIISASTWLF